MLPGPLIRLNRGIIKLVISRNGDIDDYRFFSIARQHFSGRSGIFSLEELCDILHSRHRYASLHHRPGNNRKRFMQRLSERFSRSILFTELPDGRFRINSERRLISGISKSGNRSYWYEVPDESIFRSKAKFFNFCTGVLLSGNRFRSNENIAGFCRSTVRRIQKATSFNDKNNFFFKQYNFIECFSGTYKEIKQFRAMLFHEHGISSPRPLRFREEWVLRLNAPNSYRCNVFSGVKGRFIAEPTIAKRKKCWFMPIRERDKNKMTGGVYRKRWMFTSGVYDIGSYVVDNSRLFS